MFTRKSQIVFLIAILFVGMQLLCASPIDEMTPAKTGSILGSDISAINCTFVSAYLLKTATGYILFDAGADQKQLEAGLAELGVKAGDIKWVFLSHSDGDHVASLPLFTHAQIYISDAEMPMLTGKVERGPERYNSLPDGVKVDKLIPLKDQQIVEIEDAIIQTVYAPGHTPGSTYYIINKQFLFTGDALRLSGDTYEVHPFTMDESQALKTIEASADLLHQYVILTAHYGVKVHCGACKEE